MRMAISPRFKARSFFIGKRIPGFFSRSIVQDGLRERHARERARSRAVDSSAYSTAQSKSATGRPYFRVGNFVRLDRVPRNDGAASSGLGQLWRGAKRQSRGGELSHYRFWDDILMTSGTAACRLCGGDIRMESRSLGPDEQAPPPPLLTRWLRAPAIARGLAPVAAPVFSAPGCLPASGTSSAP